MDHDGAGETSQIRLTPGGEYPHFCEAFTGGRLGTDKGRNRVGGETPTQSPLQGDFGDAGRAPERVAISGAKETEGGGGGGGEEYGGHQGCGEGLRNLWRRPTGGGWLI